MKTHCSLKSKYIVSAFFALTGLFVSCSDDEVGNYYTFTGETVGEYLETRPEYFSEFCKVLDTTNVMGLLKAYGEYTCFAPTNEAMQEIYDNKEVGSFRELTMKELKKIANDHIIKDNTIYKSDFRLGRLTAKTLSDRYLSISLGDDGDYIINLYSPIINDLSADSIHNGVIYALSSPLQPTELTLNELIQNEAETNKRFTLFARALEETALSDSLTKVEDESYDPTFYEDNNPTNDLFPQAKKYGYTALIPSDSILHAKGYISTLDDMEQAYKELKAYAKSVYDNTFPADAGRFDTDATHRKNPLNRFIGYHLHNKQMNRTFYVEKHYDTDYTTTMNANGKYTEFVETMCFAGVGDDYKSKKLNTIPCALMTFFWNSRYDKNLINYNSSRAKRRTFISGRTDIDAINGVIHEVNDVLVYDSEWVGDLTSDRLRIDVASFFPEFTNNGLRYRAESSDTKLALRVPLNYVEGLKTDDNSTLKFIGPNNGWKNLCGDELWCEKTSSYDVAMTTLSIPKGVYEVRVGYQASGNRGVVQFYFDGMPCGIPVDMNIKSDNASIGYVKPGSDSSDPYGYENDKMMRNRGYMKAPTIIWTGTTTGGSNGRNISSAIRKILITETFQEDAKHVLRMKSVKGGEFMVDYMEFIPREILEFEGID